MKKLLLLLLFLFSLSGYSQYSKKELKTLKKLELKIINKGLDLNADFIFLSDPSNQFRNSDEAFMSSVLFENNFNVGDYYYAEETNTNVINARYVIRESDIGRTFSIKDLKTQKIVATIRSKKRLKMFNRNRYKFSYVLEKLRESNN